MYVRVCARTCTNKVLGQFSWVIPIYVCCSTDDMAMLYPDRIITIRGTVDNMSLAEEAISVILRECMEKDSQTGGMVGKPDICFFLYCSPRWLSAFDL